MVARVLITTAIERTWPKDTKKPVLFLGEWCKLYKRKHVWKDLDYKTPAYHWNDRNKLYKDYLKLSDYHETLLSEISVILNQIHGTSYSVRYWRILIGPWLGWFVQIVYDRWYMLNEVLQKEEVENCIVIKKNYLNEITNDMSEFGNSIIYDDWNELIYGQLLEICWPDMIRIKYVENSDKSNDTSLWQNQIDKEINSGFKNAFRNQIKKFIPLFNRLFPKKSAYFFISSYLPLFSDFKLQIRLGQFPKLWKAPSTPKVDVDKTFRKWALKLNKTNNNPFEKTIAKLLPLHMPKIYLEGYKVLAQTADQLPWPSMPRAIFTGTLWSDTEIFKIWAAKKTEHKVPLVIGQHGGHYGTSPFSFSEDHQIKISDRFISWGWTDLSQTHIAPLGNLKGFGMNPPKYDPNGKALMVELTIPRYSYFLFAVAFSSQFLDYFEDQKVFLSSLRKDIREKILIRVNNVDYDWSLPERFKEFMPQLEVDLGHQNIRNLINESRIYIATYNATTYLESMSWNIPTIIFWDEKHWELRAEVKPLFDLLKTVGIFHTSPMSASMHLEEIWNNIDDWWFSDSVQSARLTFCNQFSKIPKDPLNELEDFFKDL